MAKVAVIGGSGINDTPLVQNLEWRTIDTGFTTKYQDGTITGGKVEYQQGNDFIFIPRHGRNIRYGPSRTQYAANLIAAKALGARVVIATSAVGTYYGETHPVKSLVIPDDNVDESGRDKNLFGTGLVVHANPKPPFSEGLREIIYRCAIRTDYGFGGVINGGTYVTIPGDNFGTRAEGLKRRQYATIVGMTANPELDMALQLGLHYAIVAFPVDKDLDANHTHGTLKVMHELSQPNMVPAYMTAVVQEARTFAESPGQLPQLKGNIIPCKNPEIIGNEYLRRFAIELMRDYC